MQDIKQKDSRLYYDIVRLLNSMKNGGGSIQWIVNIYPDSQTTRNLSKALHHINIAIDILQGTLYKKDKTS